jgi:hypothetical protein
MSADDLLAGRLDPSTPVVFVVKLVASKPDSGPAGDNCSSDAPTEAKLVSGLKADASVPRVDTITPFASITFGVCELTVEPGQPCMPELKALTTSALLYEEYGGLCRRFTKGDALTKALTSDPVIALRLMLMFHN